MSKPKETKKDYTKQPFAWKGAKQKLEEQRKAQEKRLKEITGK